MWLLMLACTGGPTIVNQEGTLVLDLVNPTIADPWNGVDSVLIELVVDGQVVEQSSFSLDEDAQVPGLDHFGTGRFRVAGLGGGTVVSYGRSAEVWLAPGVDLTIPMTFLPVNQVLPVADEMAAPRSEHLSARLPDGRVLLFGGRSPDGGVAYADLEVYDPAEGIFKPTGTYAPLGLYAASWTVRPDRTLLITGGRTILAGSGRAHPGVFQYDPVSGLLSSETDMTNDRSGHCLAEFREGFGVAMGGNRLTLAVDWMRNDPDTNELNWSDVVITGLDQAAVTGCVAVEGGEVFVQGMSANATGLFNFSEDAAAVNPNVSDAFYAVESGDFDLLEGAMLIPLDAETVWVGAGESASDTPITGRLFDIPSRSFVGGVDPARPRVSGDWDAWIEDGWYVLGCGTADGSPETPQTTVEVLNLESGERYPYLEMDRARPGCRVDALLDGAILISGGFSSGGDAEPGAAIVVPYDPA
ncbi:MAG: hypothetical protein GY913_13305 [Proteobacteria bacterium]|nr:hypothetical protein [Pseudomonadota bacterium]